MTPDDVADWMLAEIMKEGYVEQEAIVWDIAAKFGEQFTYENENGNQAIDKAVLKAFRKKSEKSVVWLRSHRAWRTREEYDEPGRRQS